ncbi:lipase family protein [Nocardia yamanashiensis]|uniref:lipase family protein n=1 Tax=Nocardia yamanashiensis TaxID=209247 RepID=UPI00082D5D08|nr:lipase family protein [Nocardia yamanashiensis]
MHAHLRRVLRLTATVLLSAGAVLGSVHTAHADAADFYLPPNTLPGTVNGELLRSEPFSAAEFTRLALLMPVGSATRVMYRSSDARGAAVAVTGTVLTPSAAWNGPGPRPLITYAIGTHGSGDACAPSKLLADTIELDATGMPMLEYDLVDLWLLLNRGFSVAVTDYQGLGTPGGHPYMQPLPAAHNVLDAARAAIRLGVAEAAAPIGIWGYSQGGGAAAAAAEQAPEYAPELDLRGVVAGAATADPAETLRYNDSNLMTILNGFFVAGLVETDPELAPRVEALLSPAGLRMVQRVSQQCVPGGTLTAAYHSTTEYTATGQTLMDALSSDPEIRCALDGFVLGTRAPAVPALVTVNVNDDTVPVSVVYALRDRWRAHGADVSELSVDTPALPALLSSLGTGHITASVLSGSPAVSWLADRLAR